MREQSASKPRRGRRAVLAIATTVLMSAAVTAGEAGPATGQTFAQSRIRHAATETCAQSKATVERLRTLTISQLDRVFETLPANPSFPNGAAQGYVWLDSSSKTPIEIQNLVHPTWQGKTFYNVLGSHIVYDVFFGQQLAPAVMHYGTSHIDGRGVLVLDWRAYTPFYDELRMIEPGVYIGNSFSDQSILSTVLLAVIPTVLSVAGVSTNQVLKPNSPLINVILDLNCPTTYWAS
jgi:hypothetical protein